MHADISTYHVPVLLNESVAGLGVRPEGKYVDLTFGGGGHARYIYSKLTTGHLYVFDQDAQAKANLEGFSDTNFTWIAANFRYVKKYLKMYGITQVDGLLADLGVSSHQFDTGNRGFSFRFDGPLDMRMNQAQTKDARSVVNAYDLQALRYVFSAYGEIDNAFQLAQSLVQHRVHTPIETTFQLKELALKHAKRHQEHKYLAQVFQALRIEVNDEIKALEEMLVQLPDILKPNARISIITYHSLEDRLVKNFIKHGLLTGEAAKDVFGNVHVPFMPINRKPIEASEEEKLKNTRSRSAKLRIAVRVDTSVHKTKKNG